MRNVNLKAMLKSITSQAVFIILVLAAVFVLPWRLVNWGKLELQNASTITLSGEAKEDVRSQIARFSAGVTAVGDTKEAVTDEVNRKVADIISKVKEFGIPEADIQTQNISVYKQSLQPTGYENPQTEILIYPPQPRQQAPWTANNSIGIILRDVDKASALADLLNQTGANQVSGPSFSLDDTSASEAKLLEEAIKDARAKDERVAEASGRKLGKIITVTEGGQSVPIYRSLEAGVDVSKTPVEPGSQTVFKTVTVVFELR